MKSHRRRLRPVVRRHVQTTTHVTGGNHASDFQVAVAVVAATAGVGAMDAATAADPMLERAAAEMRVNDVKSIRYAGAGIGWTFGQAFKPGEAWPKIKLNSWTRTVNYETGAMRDEIVLTRDEALGGGGHPHGASQRNRVGTRTIGGARRSSRSRGR